MVSFGWHVTLLSPGHDRESFSCGEPILDRYIKHLAGQDSRRNLARVYVLTKRGSDKIAGYFTISATSVEAKNFPSRLAKKIPNYPIPAALIGRLAVDQLLQGKGIGEILVLNAFKQIVRADERLAFYAVVVEAKNEKAAGFYKALGFEKFSDIPSKLFYLIGEARKVVARSML